MTVSSKTTVVGLVGGIASGKSSAAKILCEFGAVAIDADALGHAILDRPLIARQLIQEFGQSIASSEGINRNALANLVFGNSPESQRSLQTLESIVHPPIHAEAVRELRRIKEGDACPPVIVIDAPLLLEAGWAPMCDLIIFLESSREIRLARCLDRGWTEQMFEHRESAQMPLDQKKQAATHVIPSVDLATLNVELRRWWEKLSS